MVGIPERSCLLEATKSLLGCVSTDHLRRPDTLPFFDTNPMISPESPLVVLYRSVVVVYALVCRPV